MTTKELFERINKEEQERVNFMTADFCYRYNKYLNDLNLKYDKNAQKKPSTPRITEKKIKN